MIEWISVLRVLAMVMIVLCHIIGYYTFIPGHAHLGQFFNVGVEIFIFISGYLYGRKVIHFSVSYYWNRYKKICIPAIIWGIIILCATGFQAWREFPIVLFNLTGLNFLKNEWGLLHEFHGIEHTWFLTIIFMCYLILPLLQRMRLIIRGGRRCLLLMFWGVAIYLGIALECHLYYFSLFITGYFIHDWMPFKHYAWKPLLISGILFIGIAGIRVVARQYLDDSPIYDFGIVPLCMSGLSLCITVIVFEICFMCRNILNKMTENYVFKFLDKYNFPIYIVHYFWIPLIYTKLEIVCSTFVFIMTVGLSAIVVERVSHFVQYRITV